MALLSSEEWKKSVPAELQKQRWVAWGRDPKTGRPKCPLVLTDRDRRATTGDPLCWRDFKYAVGLYDKIVAQPDMGVGFVFTLEDELVYVDLDDALEEDGELRDWARPFVEPFMGRAYIERSPSSRGLHVITKGKLPESAASGGKRNFEEAQSDWAKAQEKPRVPECAMFQDGKYTTITGDVWQGQGTIGDGAEAVAQVWAAAGIQADGTTAKSGPMPTDDELPELDKRRIKPFKKALADCAAGSAPDRSAARFGFYKELGRTLTPLEIFALITGDEGEGWYEGSGAAEKGKPRLWADICKACGEITSAKEEFKAENEQALVRWKEIGIPMKRIVTKEGTIEKPVDGAQAMVVCLTRHPKWKGRFRLNTFVERIELDGKPMDECMAWLAEELREYLRWDREPRHDLVWKAIMEAAKIQSYNPVADWLNGLSWDGQSRLDDWLVRAGCEDTPLNRTIGRKWLIAMVARALDPGCHMESVLILHGPQGYMKSTLLRTLAGDALFTSSKVNLDKDGMMVLHSKWLIELAELTTFRRNEADSIKQFISEREDVFRPPYGRTTVSKPRHFCLSGTTNGDEYLTDPTGNRRIWPVRVTERLDPQVVALERDQLFSEAVAAFREGTARGADELYWFREDPAELRETQRAVEAHDALEDLLADFMAERRADEFTIVDAMRAAGLDDSIEKRDVQMRVANILRRNGFASRQAKRNGKNQRYWFDPALGLGMAP